MTKLCFSQVRVLFRCPPAGKVYLGDRENASDIRYYNHLPMQQLSLLSKYLTGPIVRISPYELHINDPDYYDELYSGGSKKRDKYEWAAKLFGNSGSMLGTIV